MPAPVRGQLAHQAARGGPTDLNGDKGQGLEAGIQLQQGLPEPGGQEDVLPVVPCGDDIVVALPQDLGGVVLGQGLPGAPVLLQPSQQCRRRRPGSGP